MVGKNTGLLENFPTSINQNHKSQLFFETGTRRDTRKYRTFYRRMHPLSNSAYTYRILPERKFKGRFRKRRTPVGLELQNVIDTRHCQGRYLYC